MAKKMSGGNLIGRSMEYGRGNCASFDEHKEKTMSEFLYLYRLSADSLRALDSPQQMQERLKKWSAWFKDLEAENHIKNPGHPLDSNGAVVKDKRGTVTDGPYAESKDIVGGYTLVEARDLAEATQLASGCPVLERGGVVEVRPIRQM
jgi:hypothetical protein